MTLQIHPVFLRVSAPFCFRARLSPPSPSLPTEPRTGPDGFASYPGGLVSASFVLPLGKTGVVNNKPTALPRRRDALGENGNYLAPPKKEKGKKNNNSLDISFSKMHQPAVRCRVWVWMGLNNSSQATHTVYSRPVVTDWICRCSTTICPALGLLWRTVHSAGNTSGLFESRPHGVDGHGR